MNIGNIDDDGLRYDGCPGSHLETREHVAEAFVSDRLSEPFHVTVNPLPVSLSVPTKSNKLGRAGKRQRPLP